MITLADFCISLAAIIWSIVPHLPLNYDVRYLAVAGCHSDTISDFSNSHSHSLDPLTRVVYAVQMFGDIGAICPLKQLASGTNKLASKFAAQALSIIGEEVPHKLSPQVPLWSVEDVRHWLSQVP